MAEPLNTDVSRIKALAHPIRLALLEYLNAIPEATATQCAAAIKESVASCSFHLRTLAKYGYIEQAQAPDAKSKPWRRIADNKNTIFEPESPESLSAISALGSVVVDQVSKRLNDFLAVAPTLPESAIARSILANKNLWLTPQEHEQLIATFMDACAVYLDRSSDPSQRPVGALHTHLFFAATPDLADYAAPATTQSPTH